MQRLTKRWDSVKSKITFVPVKAPAHKPAGAGWRRLVPAGAGTQVGGRLRRPGAGTQPAALAAVVPAHSRLRRLPWCRHANGCHAPAAALVCRHATLKLGPV